MKFKTNYLKALTVLLAIAGADTAKAQSKQQPNIVFIVTDDQHRNEFNFLKEGRDSNGNPTNLSPNIDKLAKEGVIFDNSYVSTSVCTPSRYTILTGYYASRGVNDSNIKKYQGQTNVAWNVDITDQTNTIAKVLQSKGYYTGMVGKNHVIHGDNVHKVPSKADVTNPVIKQQLIDNQNAQIEAVKKAGFDYGASLYKGNLPHQYPKAVEDHNMEWIVDGALKFLDKAAKKDNPFFLYFATTLAHGPDKMGKKYLGNPLATPVGFLDKPLDVMPSRESITERIQKAGLDNEKTDVLWLDDGIGALLDKLRAMKALENTVIFFIDDHGVEHGKGSLYEGGIKTVSFAWGPKYFNSGIRTKEMVSNIDIVPTALELAGVDLKTTYKMDGVSMLPLMCGLEMPIHESLYFEIGATRAVLKDGYKYLAFKAPPKMKALLEKDGKKATHICDKPGGRGTESNPLKFYAKNYFSQEQVYNITSDPLERTNLMENKSEQARINDLKKTLIQYIEQVPGSFPIDIATSVVK